MKTHAGLFSSVFENETEHGPFLLNLKLTSLQSKTILKKHLREQMAQVFV